MIHDPFEDTTIAAHATPPGTSALAVVRVSGIEALSVVARIFRGEREVESMEGFRGAVGRIIDPRGTVDEVVIWVYRAPRSYTGEDLVEISCHGGSLPARRVLDAVLGSGARPAGPGEFTRRAFLNGRIDLVQAEAVASLIESRGRRAQELALTQLEGGLSREVNTLADGARNVLARITVFLDFEEDVPEPPDTARLRGEIARIQEGVDRLVASYAPSNRLREGFTLALAGRPNVGKSSLLNALAGYDRAIVHSAPGTTRDVVDVLLEWNGVPVRLLDTAGLRNGGDAVENIGIERTRREIRETDAVVWVLDGSVPPNEDDTEIASRLNGSPIHVVLNKSDLGEADHEWVNVYSPKSKTRLSAKTGDGMSVLINKLQDALLSETAGALDSEGVCVTSQRQAHALRDASIALGSAGGVLEKGEPAELAAADLTRCLRKLGEITGSEAGPELLDSIFLNFCIGK